MVDAARSQRRTRLLAAVAVLWLAIAAATAHGQDISNVYMAGAEVRIDAPVSGDLFAAAGRISVDQPVNGDAVLAAGAIDLRSRIGDDLRAVGGIVSLTGRVYGEALIAGGSIAFGPDTEILGRVTLAGGNIAVAGRLANGLFVYGKNILLLGEINGDIRLTGERIEILPSARIYGGVRYSSDNAIIIGEGAQVHGKIMRAPGSFEFPLPKFEIPGLPALRPLLYLGLLAAGIVLLAVFPRFTAASLRTVGATPFKSLGLGTAILFSLPPVILLLVITIIGLPIALALAAFYAVALLIGYLVTAFFIGDRLARAVRRQTEPTFGWRVGSLAVALLLLWGAYLIPYVGAFVILIALVVGLGAMVLQAFSDYANRAQSARGIR